MSERATLLCGEGAGLERSLLPALFYSPAASEPKARCGSKSRKGLDLTHTQSSSLSESRQVDADVLARLQGSSLTPFEPMSQDNSRRFPHYCHPSPLPEPQPFPRMPSEPCLSERRRHPLISMRLKTSCELCIRRF